jgi:hypothetical protein
MTTPDRVSELFHRAMGLAPEQRGAFLDQECGDDRGLRAEVESLLGYEAESFLEALGLYDGKSSTERAVLRMARRLGEADLDVPDKTMSPPFLLRHSSAKSRRPSTFLWKRSGEPVRDN